MIFSLRVNTFFVNHLEVPLIFHTLFSPFQETFIWYILFLYRNKNKEKKFEMRCQFFFFENYEKHVIEEKKITIHKLYSECTCGVVKFHRGAKIHSLRLNKASVEFHISHPHETIHLTLIQYEGGGKTIYSTICPHASVSITLYY